MKSERTTIKVNFVPRGTGRRPVQQPRRITIHDDSRLNASTSWRDRIELSQTARRSFTVVVERHAQQQSGNSARKAWRRILRKSVSGIKTPSDLSAALLDCAAAVDVTLDLDDVIELIADMDWTTAAVIAQQRNLPLPPLPEVRQLLLQRSRRSLGKVRIGVEWGYDLHEVSLPLEQWVKVLQGGNLTLSDHYYYDGQAAVVRWCFDGCGGRQELEIEGEDGFQGWVGKFANIPVLEGREIDGVDLAKLCLRAR